MTRDARAAAGFRTHLVRKYRGAAALSLRSAGTRSLPRREDPYILFDAIPDSAVDTFLF